MNCLDFRRAVGADPGASDAALLAHRRECTACAHHHDELLAMDALLLRALSVEIPPRKAVAPRVPRRAWMALAASVIAGLFVGMMIWASLPAPSLADEVIGHVAHEPMALQGIRVVSRDEIAAVLEPNGASLRDDAGEVIFATRCLFDGHMVPHLVVRTGQGLVTVLLLQHRSVDGAVRLADQGFAGVVLPAPRGSIAIVVQGQMDLDAIAEQVSGAVEWADEARIST